MNERDVELAFCWVYFDDCVAGAFLSVSMFGELFCRVIGLLPTSRITYLGTCSNDRTWSDLKIEIRPRTKYLHCVLEENQERSCAQSYVIGDHVSLVSYLSCVAFILPLANSLSSVLIFEATVRHALYKRWFDLILAGGSSHFVPSLTKASKFATWYIVVPKVVND